MTNFITNATMITRTTTLDIVITLVINSINFTWERIRFFNSYVRNTKQNSIPQAEMNLICIIESQNNYYLQLFILLV